ncbi:MULTISPECIES: ABC transporter ATP-binding protein [unclassified Shinella]|uniref:ABC transporter ATP-binding protein n=1 Tax=unclassified Shinella TaxID=2643062 RepID=UPI00225D8ADD|nr:ABC transporter ATP-binding protein [Shinella sp. YE25]MDC7259688.1 ABC transporter ATP-binding protein [Shinella sp. YE25]CAI0334109.1 murein tripeptide ABC transporter/oligopeptide ABC transporter ATP binding subunit OppD [Rhizobiaceae bacterium]CAK7261762.1 murein tripeptide ABC transporter/oligopeptide ABC transporter ATP binding subunit OppD [Shinella sp. WSC3-e]
MNSNVKPNADASRTVAPGGNQGPILTVDALEVGFSSGGKGFSIVEGVSFAVNAGRTLAVVGESGSGKSVTSLALLGLLGKLATTRGHAAYRTKDGRIVDLLQLQEKELRSLRGEEISMIFQEPMTALNPVLHIEDQLVEVLHNHQKISQLEARRQALEMLRFVGIPDAERRLRTYPHELSGGMRQRIMIASALMRRPNLLIADEPTTALDVTIQAQILRLLRRLQRSLGMAMIFITHDLGVVGQIADDVVVMYSGRVVETGPVQTVLQAPQHPYTQGLLGSAPRVSADGTPAPLTPIPGIVPSPASPPPGCRFHPRCSQHVEGVCDGIEPKLESVSEIQQVRCVRWQQIAATAEVRHV